MTGFLLDRDVLGACENPRGHRNVKLWIDGVPDNDLYISAVTVMEARKGFAKLLAKSNTVLEARRIRAFEADFDTILNSFDDRVLPINRAVADRWGELLAQRETNAMDTAVAATAAIFGLVVATRNLKHFRDRGVRMLDPFKINPRIEEPRS